jgi:hypothetical protein
VSTTIDLHKKKLRNEDFLRVNPQYTEWFADIKKRLVNGII